MAVKVLILAGSRPEPDLLARQENVSHKALIDLGGTSMLARIVATVRNSATGEIFVASNDPAVRQQAGELGATPVAAEAGPSATVLSVLKQHGAPLLVTTSDHALLRAEWVGHLIEATNADCDLSVMLARRDLVEAELPHSKRTYLRFADGDWSGCNLFYLASDRAVAAVELWRAVEKDRKRPWKIAARIGPGTLLAMAFKRLTVSQAIGRLGAKIGTKAMVVAAHNGQAAVDADTPQDLVDIRALLARQAAASVRDSHSEGLGEN